MSGFFIKRIKTDNYFTIGHLFHPHVGCNSFQLFELYFHSIKIQKDCYLNLVQ